MVAWVEEFSHRKYARPFLAVYKMEATKAVWVRDYVVYVGVDATDKSSAKLRIRKNGKKVISDKKGI